MGPYSLTLIAEEEIGIEFVGRDRRSLVGLDSLVREVDDLMECENSQYPVSVVDDHHEMESDPAVALS